jgi:hypothetical protein
MGIGAVVAVVTEDEVFVLRHCLRTIGIVEILVDIGLIKRESIAVHIGDINRSILYLYHLSRERDNPFYKRTALVLGGVKNNHIAPLWFTEPVGRFYDQYSFTGVKVRLHADALYDSALHSKLHCNKDEQC